MPSKVGTKGQVVIEKGIRDELGIEPGSLAIQRIVDGHVEIHFVKASTRSSLKGRLRPFISEEIIARTSKMNWSEIEEEAWRTWVAERYGSNQD